MSKLREGGVKENIAIERRPSQPFPWRSDKSKAPAWNFGSRATSERRHAWASAAEATKRRAVADAARWIETVKARKR